MWFSPDGFAWSRTIPLQDSQICDVVATDDGYVADDWPPCMMPAAVECGYSDVMFIPAYRDPDRIAAPIVTDTAAWFRLTGHFDDPRSSACDDVADCRGRFVATSAAPTAAP